MSGIPVAICLTVSVLAAGISTYTLTQTQTTQVDSSISKTREIEEFREALDALGKEIDLLVSRQALLEQSHLAAASRPSPDSSSQAAQKIEISETDEQFAALHRRLEQLENPDTIAQLAQSGTERARKKKYASAHARSLDTNLPVLDRVRAFRALRKSGMRSDESVRSMLGLLSDSSLDPKTRIGIVQGLIGVRTEDVKQPMLDILNYGTNQKFRGEAMNVLMFHGDDPVVSETIRRVSTQDEDEELREYASDRIPKMEWLTANNFGQDK